MIMKTNCIQSLKQFSIAIAVLATVWLTTTQASAFTVLAGWDVSGLANSGPSPFTPTVSGTGLTVVGLTRGSGVGATTTANVWGGNNWTNTGVVDSESQAISGNKFATFSIAPATNYTVSFNGVDKFYYSHSGTGPASGVFEYSLDGSNFTDVQSISYSASGSTTIDLSSIAALQNVGYGTNVFFRIVNWGATGTAGTWYIANGNTSGNDFELLGTVTQTSSGIPPGNVSVTPTNITTNVNSTVSFTVSATGDQPTYSWYQEVGGTTNLVSTSGPTFTLPNVTTANSGNYQVVLVNDAGSITSSVVTLAVTDPAITASPANLTNVLNDVDYFSATAVASQPAELYWYYNGALVTNFDAAGITNTGTIYVTNNPAATNLGGYYLVVSNQFGMATSTVAMATIALTPSVEIARWDFNATNNYTATNPATSIGTGLGAPVPNPAVTNFIFAPGALFDPLQLVSGSTNEAWELDGFGSTVSNKTAGFQFNVSTAGYTNILLTWSERHSATASKYMRVQYSTDGTNFVDGDVETFSAVAYQFYSSALTNAGVANNPNFAFRVVAEWESTAIATSNTNYDGTSSAFGSGGTIRVDLMTVFGNPLGSVVSPIPLHIQLAGTNVVLTWNDPTSAFSLQAAPLATGTYNTVSGATSPYTNAITGSQQYFRLKSN
jgi:hypothetical protein